MKLSYQFRVLNHFRSRPPVDVEGLARALDVDVKYAHLDGDTSGMLEKLKDGYRITVNAMDPPTRQRFTMAHELGHYMLHKGLVDDGVDDDRAYRSTKVGIYHNTKIGPKEETEANRFAANLLMPKDLIDEIIKTEGIKEPRELAKKFGVSEHAMSIRLGKPYEIA